MQNITTRLKHAEAVAEARARKAAEIPVMLLREDQSGVYTHSSGTVLHGREEVERFAAEHYAQCVVIDDIPRKQERQHDSVQSDSRILDSQYIRKPKQMLAGA